MEGDSAIQQDAQQGAADAAGEKKEAPKGAMKNPRDEAMAAMKASRRAAFEAETGIKLDAPAEAIEAAQLPADEAADKPVVEEQTTSADTLSVSTQLGKQLEDGMIELSPEDLKRIRERTKVDGQEQLVEGSKALGQYQKGAAAELRLEQATKAQRDAAAALEAANAKLAEASTVAEKKAADKAVQVAEADLAAKKQKYFDALYGGDTEQAGKLFDEMLNAAVETAVAGRVNKDATPIDPEKIAARAAELAVPVVKQVTSRESALSALKADYPEIFNDPDYSRAADRMINEIISTDSSKSLADAILEGGAAAAKKFGLVKSSERQAKGKGTTTRAELAARKEGLDEPNATAARAATTVARPLTPSERIEQMRRARNPGA
jgi:hypothetical protein